VSSASVYPSLRLYVAGASEEGAIPVSHLGYQRFGERGVEGHRLTNSRVAKGACAKARLWSHGDVRLVPGVKLRRVGFHEGPVDWIHEVPIGI
jgi:hypothetical protein